MKDDWSVWWSEIGSGNRFNEHSEMMSEVEAKEFAATKAGEARTDSVILVQFDRVGDATVAVPVLIVHL